MVVRRFTLPSPVGQLIILASDKGLHGVEFADREDRITRLVAKTPWGDAVEDGPADDRLAACFAAYFEGDIRALDGLAVDPHGTDFEREVWAALRAIPAGETRSYGDLAKAVGRPKASRAIGRANGLNPIALVQPCHRVIGANGTLTGYAGGLERKSWLLRHEGVVLV